MTRYLQALSIYILCCILHRYISYRYLECFDFECHGTGVYSCLCFDGNSWKSYDSWYCDFNFANMTIIRISRLIIFVVFLNICAAVSLSSHPYLIIASDGSDTRSTFEDTSDFSGKLRHKRDVTNAKPETQVKAPGKPLIYLVSI